MSVSLDASLIADFSLSVISETVVKLRRDRYQILVGYCDGAP